MKKLNEIVKNVKTKKVIGEPDKPIGAVHFDSREVTKGSLFVAIKGLTVDGHKFIENAVKKGASAILCENIPENKQNEITYIQTQDTSEALGLAAAEFFDRPSEKLQLIGITGTNGKTTTATLLYQLLLGQGSKTGLISTIANYINDEKIATRFTTPDALTINRILKEMVDSGCEYVFMEVSSHALKQKRTCGLKFSGAVFTNITHEHLDYHKTFKDYIESKKLLFDHYLDDNAFALINKDDRNSGIMVQNTPATVHSFALKTAADYKGKILEKHVDGTLININGKEIWSRFIGQFNAYNLLAVYAVANLLGYDEDVLLRELSNLKPVDGRFETIRSGNKTVVVDYAHSPDALENVLIAINDLKKEGQKIITLTGAGGDRDKTKRPEMAEIAVQYSDKVVLTSDNPRTEKPEDILADMQKGIPGNEENKVITIIDRKEGIKTACMLADDNDIILIAGKGHETYQEVNGIRHHFDDREVVRAILNKEKV